MAEPTNIENRPEELFELPYYRELPDLPVTVDMSGSIGKFLEFDLFDLDGVQPLELRHMIANDRVVSVNPSEKSIEIYKKEKVTFQLVFIVVNAYGFKEVDGVLVGKPYNISLQPASKRGELSVTTPEWIEHIDFEEQNLVPKIYNGFNPFSGACGLHMMGYTDYTGIESDMIGFVVGTYALAMPFKHSEVLSPGVPEPLRGNKQVRQDYEKYRKNWYFKPFKKVKPKRIWGCDSPIELFLLQAMDSIGLYPELQTIICEDGFTVPGFHKLWENAKSRRRLKTITDADYYFSDKKLAVFCDSIAYHSSVEAVAKDKAIDIKLNKIGITSMRICGRDIATSPIECANRIRDKLTGMA
ncbi:hypothetical protein K8B83_02025 [Shewanella inventionis]|uniref:hypothetical protein n=1 Tax=Shewanella inventionis TaxID=1738770 RepID=UPI001CBDBE6C|nr:hypothetical protein [Shewanella inventionis]UAL43692.1 hypothetical protein K8B83_02025 [Shewanella inventionis]